MDNLEIIILLRKRIKRWTKNESGWDITDQRRTNQDLIDLANEVIDMLLEGRTNGTKRT